MKGIALLTILTLSLHAQAAEFCGLFQAEDFRARGVVVSLIDFQTYLPNHKTYTITNALDSNVAGLVIGQCYCLEGNTSIDTNYADSMYQLLEVSRMVRGPYVGCLPASN